MGLFGNIFDKKTCAICGGDIGLLGNRKLEDGNLCKQCANKLSPFFSERRHSTVEDIRQQLEYREANKAAVEAFQVTRTFNARSTILVDENAGNFLIARGRNWRNENPDVIPCSSVTGVTVNQDEMRREIMYEDSEGNRQSYSPRRYEISYDFDLVINVNNPYFDRIEVQLNDDRIDKTNMVAFMQIKDLGEEIKQVLTKPMAEARAAAAAPKVAIKCPACGATGLPTESGTCEWCGAALL